MPVLFNLSKSFELAKSAVRNGMGPSRGALTNLVAKVSAPNTGQKGGDWALENSTDASEVPVLDRIRLERQLILPCNPESGEEITRARFQDQGQFLARQDRWQELATLIGNAEQARAITPGGMSHAALLAYGARADVVHAAEDAINDGTMPNLAGIEALEAILAEFPRDAAIALVVAHTHMDIGWAWRGDAADHAVSEKNLARFHAHFKRAEGILDGFDGVEIESPAIAAARVALLAAAERPQDHVADDYEDLIDLDPHNPRAMRAMGNHLLPRWFGSYETLELEARRTASRSIDIWGAGGYTWCYLDALTVDSRAANLLDVDFFVEGLRDILDRRPDQHMANQIAAYCAVTMSPEHGHFVAHSVQKQLFECFDWILTDHLRELHPLVWAQAVRGPELATALQSKLSTREALWRFGHNKARDIIAHHFQDDLAQGTTITFSRHGLRLYPAM